jgi:cyclic beta-1,2-glucan synthetase
MVCYRKNHPRRFADGTPHARAAIQMLSTHHCRKGRPLHPLLRRALGRAPPVTLWDDEDPIRSELFGIERLEQHAESLAANQPVAAAPMVGKSLVARLADNERVLLAAYRGIAAAADEARPSTPAAEWLLDNYHLVEQQVREVRTDLPPGYYRQLPKLSDGPLAGYPRVFGVAWAFVAHTDSRFDSEALIRFVRAYQTVQPLTIGELWAVAITRATLPVLSLRQPLSSSCRCSCSCRPALPARSSSPWS